MRELNANQVRITDRFWQPRLAMNARQAIAHQWDQLEKTGCLDNFRLAAGRKEGFREGWFFADSDAYKWLDAACRIQAVDPSAELAERIDALIGLIEAAQAEDGYLFTYNQVHFPGVRWTNLQIEHELYCHGHLIEAAVSHYQATGQRRLLSVAQKAADLLVREFLDAGPEGTPGHEEIEIALLNLSKVTVYEEVRTLAERFIERRGRIRPFAPLIVRQNRSVGRRLAWVRAQRERYLAAHPEHAAFSLPVWHVVKKPPLLHLRYLLSALSGRYFQQHRPVREQRVPVGHAVRFAYLATATAMLYRERGDETLLPALEEAWQRMVNRRMHLTGGIGSLPEIEGFGRDYELDPEVAYAETCAALGCMFWNWEMLLITGQAQYADLFEWQLYNASAAGMGLDGRSYLYNNPLACRGGMARQAWFQVPCCPSNLSRTWASLGRYLVAGAPGALWVHQYVGSEAQVDVGVPAKAAITSGLPWQGTVAIRLWPESRVQFTLTLRIPSWVGDYHLMVNGQPLETMLPAGEESAVELTASGYAPQRADSLSLTRTWAPGDSVELEFSLPIAVRRPHPQVKSLRGRAALTRGPLVYCLESVDNPGFDLFETPLNLQAVRAEHRPDLLGGVWVLRGETAAGQAFSAIPYYAWANRGESQMAVWVRG